MTVHSARRGMTLMELVIGLAITGMMAAAGAAAFASIIDHRQRIRGAGVETERASALREMIHSWIAAGNVQVQRGGGPRGLTRAAGGVAGGGGRGSSMAAVSAAVALGDEITLTTTALNPSLLGNVRIRMYIDGDPNTPEYGLCIEYQPNAQQPLVRKMLDSTIDTLKVEYLDQRTGRWFRASEGATITIRATRITLVHGEHPSPSPLYEIPMIFPVAAAVTVTAR